MSQEEEETPQTTRRRRRRTRLSSSSNHTQNETLKKPITNLPSLTLKNVTFNQNNKPFNYDDLISSIPGRKPQITPTFTPSVNSPLSPLFIYGAASTVEGLDGNMVYLVFDSLELVKDWDKSCTIFPLLFRLNDVLKVDGVGLVFVSGASIDTYHLDTGFVDPVPVYFPDYTEEDLRQIFMRNQSNLKLRSAFLE
ncbi:origin of replication complex subunit 5 [Tanacetum coccineum]